MYNFSAAEFRQDLLNPVDRFVHRYKEIVFMGQKAERGPKEHRMIITLWGKLVDLLMQGKFDYIGGEDVLPSYEEITSRTLS